jgi:hypothetical protein
MIIIRGKKNSNGRKGIDPSEKNNKKNTTLTDKRTLKT